MIAGVADTHAIIWYLAADPRLSSQAKAFIDLAASNGDEVAVSAITLDELNDPVSLFIETPVDLKIAWALMKTPYWHHSRTNTYL